MRTPRRVYVHWSELMFTGVLLPLHIPSICVDAKKRTHHVTYTLNRPRVTECHLRGDNLKQFVGYLHTVIGCAGPLQLTVKNGLWKLDLTRRSSAIKNHYKFVDTYLTRIQQSSLFVNERDFLDSPNDKSFPGRLPDECSYLVINPVKKS